SVRSDRRAPRPRSARPPRARPTAPTIASSANAPGSDDLEPLSELGVGHRPDPAARGDAGRRDHVGLGLARRAEAEPGTAVWIERDRPRDVVRSDIAADGCFAVVAHDADHREVGLALVRAVERPQRALLLPARDAPRVPEVHDVGLARKRAGT